MFEGARGRVAAFAGSTPGETILTRNATEALNLVAWSWGRAPTWTRGDVIALTEMEHHSNIVPWQMLAQDRGARPGVRRRHRRRQARPRLPRCRVGDKAQGARRRPCLQRALDDQPDRGDRAPRARRRRDPRGRRRAGGAAPAGRGGAALGVDFYAWTGHKAYGPTGIGVLHGRMELLEAMPPWLGGGHMIKRVGRDESTYMEPPARFEAGTSAIAEGDRPRRRRRLPVGDRDGRGPRARARDRRVRARALRRARRRHRLRAGRRRRQRGGALAFNLEGAHPHDVSEILGREGVCIRAGHHCAQPLMRRLGVAATSRASFAVHTTRDDVDRLVDALGSVRSVFG